MIDEDFYIEESNPKKIFFTSLFILFLIGLGLGAYYYLNQKGIIKLKTVTIELGDSVPTDISYYLNGQNTREYILDTTAVHVDENGKTDSVGEYSYKVIKGTTEKRGKIFVKDTKPPEVTLLELTVGLNEEFEVDDFAASCIDLSGACFLEYAKDKDSFLASEEGTYELSIIIKDRFENKVTKTTKLIVSKEASLSDIKASDMEVSAIYPQDENWNKTYTKKYNKGFTENDEIFDAEILELSNESFDDNYEEKIVNQTLLTIYNKYNYVIGFSVKLEFENENIIYVTK